MGTLISIPLSQREALQKLKFVNVGEHATKRYNERFGTNNKIYTQPQVNKIIKDLFPYCSYQGYFADSQNKRSHCFLVSKEGHFHDKMQIFVTEDWKKIATLFIEKINEKPPEKIVKNDVLINFRKKIKNNYELEIRKITRQLNKHEKDFEFLKLKSNLKLAEINLQNHKTRSENIKLQNEVEKKNIDNMLDKQERKIQALKMIKVSLENELKEIKFQ